MYEPGYIDIICLVILWLVFFISLFRCSDRKKVKNMERNLIYSKRDAVDMASTLRISCKKENRESGARENTKLEEIERYLIARFGLDSSSVLKSGRPDIYNSYMFRIGLLRDDIEGNLFGDLEIVFVKGDMGREEVLYKFGTQIDIFQGYYKYVIDFKHDIKELKLKVFSQEGLIATSPFVNPRFYFISESLNILELEIFLNKLMTLSGKYIFLGREKLGVSEMILPNQEKKIEKK